MKTDPSNKNYLSSVLYLVLIVVLVLIALNFIPVVTEEKLHVKHMDILADAKKEIVDIDIPADTLPPPPRLDSCRNGLTCFEDYSSGRNGLNSFLEALTKKRSVRIAFYGDSFIEGDILSGDLREKLQGKFGGRGPGMLPLTSNVSSFRKTVIHQFGGWRAYSLLDTFRTPGLGIGGNSFVPASNSWVYYGGSSQKAHLDSCRKVSVFYRLQGNSSNIYYKINKSISGEYPLVNSGKVERLDIMNDSTGYIGNIGLNFPNNNGLLVYGISMEDTGGIILDNFSIRGTSGTALKALSENMLSRFDSLMDYNLIILEYGLNVMEPRRTEYKKYQENMVKTIQHLQASFPGSDILLISVSDRSMRQEGKYQTMPAVEHMVSAQKQICAETGIVFWNLYEAMGGKNSMVDFVNSSPPRANKDYTHLTFEGGRVLGDLLFETILFEKERYDERKAYHEKIN